MQEDIHTILLSNLRHQLNPLNLFIKKNCKNFIVNGENPKMSKQTKKLLVCLIEVYICEILFISAVKMFVFSYVQRITLIKEEKYKKMQQPRL